MNRFVNLHFLIFCAPAAIGCGDSSVPPAPVLARVSQAIVGAATYDSTLKAPSCRAMGISACDSGSLLVGRGALGPEANAPNTINNSCADGSSGTLHSDESLDRIVVSTVDGAPFSAGKLVRIDATAWVWSATTDKLDFFYASNASAPSWTLIATLAPSAAGSKTVSATYVLPSGSLQAIRVQFRYGGSAIACTNGIYDDRDDLVFAVGEPSDAAPVISITSPAEGTTLSAPTTITASAADDLGVAKVEFYRDGATLIGTASSPPFSANWNPFGSGDGLHLLTAKAFDTTGHTTVSAPVTVSVSNPDPNPPQVVINHPTVGSTLMNQVFIVVNAIDNDDGIASVAIFVDGALIGTSTAPPYSASWDSRSAPNGLHTFSATACDPAGHCVSTSQSFSVSNDFVAPVIAMTSPTDGATVFEAISVAADASDDRGIGRVDFYLDGSTLIGTRVSAPFSINWNSATVADGSHTLTGTVTDIGANVVSSTVAITVQNADTTPPTTSILEPTEGTTISGVTTLRASATDNRAVAKVEFYVDGATLVGTVSASPYSVAWDATSVANGVHVINCAAYDSAGNRATSVPVNVIVAAPPVPTPAVYDDPIGAPVCADASASCDSGSLLNGRGSSEAHASNTIAKTCPDGTYGVYHSDESLDRLKISTLDGSTLAAGKSVRIDATVWAYSYFANDRLDLYFSANASAPSWVFLGTLSPTQAGAQTLSMTYTLPSGSLQAVRGQFRYSGTAGTCTAGNYNERDDLVFAVSP